MTTFEELVRRFTDPPILRHAAGPAAAAWQPDAAPGLTPEQAARAPGLHGLVVVRGGRVALEHYGAGPDFSWGKAYGEVAFGPQTLHDLRSVTKSIVALLYGIALEAGQVPAPEEPLGSQFPEYGDLPGHGLTVGHALTMTLGLEWNEDVPYTDPTNGEIAMMLAADRWRYVLERPVVEEPGSRWSYCGGASELVGRLLAKGTGVPLPEYARTVLFEPLGIGTFEWLAGHDQVASAASGLRLAPRDLARIGQTVLDGGRWRDRQVVPAAWLEAVLQPRVQTGWGAEYGYQWYLGGDGPRRWVGANGNGDQRLFVFPELELVVAMTAGNYEGDGSMPPTLVDDVILTGL